jgi:hypothetical protein
MHVNLGHHARKRVLHAFIGRNPTNRSGKGRSQLLLLLQNDFTSGDVVCQAPAAKPADSLAVTWRYLRLPPF